MIFIEKVHLINNLYKIPTRVNINQDYYRVQHKSLNPLQFFFKNVHILQFKKLLNIIFLIFYVTGTIVVRF